MSGFDNQKKNERVYETLAILGDSKFDSCILQGGKFRIRKGGTNKYGDYYYLDVHKDVLDFTLREAVEANQSREKKKEEREQPEKKEQTSSSRFSGKFYG